MSNSKRKTSRRQFITGGSAAAGALAFTVSVGNNGSASAHEVQINAMSPTPEQMQEFMKLPEGPVVMVNLLKFKPDGGAEAYAQYARDVSKILAKLGARIIFSGEAKTCLIGDADWDAIGLVEYPNKTALLQMTQSEEYQAIHHNREDGLEGQVNYAVIQNPTP